MSAGQEPPVVNLQDYLLIKDAAAYLGISAATLRNWERAGKIRAYRNPINGYRLFHKSDLHELLGRIQRSGTRGRHDSMT